MYDKCEKGRLVRKKKKPGKDHMCKECVYASYSKWYLKRHLRQVHDRNKSKIKRFYSSTCMTSVRKAGWSETSRCPYCAFGSHLGTH
jgi:hypothetical protein